MIEKKLSAFLRFAPWLALGPITGPLAAGLFRALRAREHTLAALYGAAIIGTWVTLLDMGQHSLITLATLAQ